MSTPTRRCPGATSPGIIKNAELATQLPHRSDEASLRKAGVLLFVDAIASARPTMTAVELDDLRALLEARTMARCS